MQRTFIYEHTDIPPGMTCDEYRRLRVGRTPRRRKRLSLRRRPQAL
jgi:hypothetical protein